MLLFAAAIASALPQDAPKATVRSLVDARATVRIVSGARIEWDQKEGSAEIPPVKATVVQTTEGPRPAKLIEFE